MGIDLAAIWHGLPDLGRGLVVTLQLTVMSVWAGFFLAVPLGVLRSLKNPWVSGPIWVYTYVFRGTPLLIQLYLIYYGLAQFDWIKDSFLWTFLSQGFWCGVLGLTLNTAAYTAEILRGAIQNVSVSEVEAARSVGMSNFLILRRIILPQAVRIMLPAYSNEVVMLMQATSLSSLITVMDLTGWARVIIAYTFAPYELFITIGLIYLGITYLIVWLFRKWEYRLMRHLGEQPISMHAQRLATR